MNKKAYYGEFGGQYVAESLMNTLEELDHAFEEAIKDEEFIKEYHYYLNLNNHFDLRFDFLVI